MLGLSDHVKDPVAHDITGIGVGRDIVARVVHLRAINITSTIQKSISGSSMSAETNRKSIAIRGVSSQQHKVPSIVHISNNDTTSIQVGDHSIIG